MKSCVLIRGGGDLATGVAVRLYRAGIRILITELPQPLAVRRAVSLSEAVYESEWKVEEVAARRAETFEQALALAAAGTVPVLVDPELVQVAGRTFHAIVDARLTKRPPEGGMPAALLLIGLGPGFTAGQDCHAVVETRRGPTVGRVYWSGAAQADTSMPEGDPQRVLRSPIEGVITARTEIGQHVETGQLVATVGGAAVISPFPGVVRGLIRPGLAVPAGLKIGDVDPRNTRELCFQVSDKALAVGGGVLEVLLSRADLRNRLWN